MLNAIPVLVLTGDKDRLVDPPSPMRSPARCAIAELVKIRGAGHAVILELPEECNEAIARS